MPRRRARRCGRPAAAAAPPAAGSVPVVAAAGRHRARRRSGRDRAARARPPAAPLGAGCPPGTTGRPWASSGPIGWVRAPDARDADPPRPLPRARPRGDGPPGPPGPVDPRRPGRWHRSACGLFRLDEPARMHFDEVYHARTAAEFLQDWRYGISHDIYEWTHPHLAKYAIAGAASSPSRATTSPPRATSGCRSGTPPIEPRREDPAGTADRAGDRVWVATGSELVAYDLATRKARRPLVRARGLRRRLRLVGPPGLRRDGRRRAARRRRHRARRDDRRRSLVPAADRGPRGHPRRRHHRVSSRSATASGWLRSCPETGSRWSDPGTGAVTGTLVVAGAADLTAMGDGDAVLATPADVTDPAAAADELAAITGGDAAGFRDAAVTGRHRQRGPGRRAHERAPDGPEGRHRRRPPARASRIDTTPLLAVSGAAGVDLVTVNGTLAGSVPLEGGAAAAALVSGVDDGTQLVRHHDRPPTGDPEVAVIAVVGRPGQGRPRGHHQLPASRRRHASRLRRGLGAGRGARAPRRTGRGTTVYVVEPHGKSVFADHKLPFEPSAWVLDHNGDYPATTPRRDPRLRVRAVRRPRSTSAATSSRGGCPA